MAGIVAVHSMKGGVGKTTLAVNLAYAAASEGARTLLWDLDAQGAATFLLGEQGGGTTAKNARRIFSKDIEASASVIPTHYDGLDLITADLSLRQIDVALDADKPKRLRKLLSSLKHDYDYIILDCPPGLGALSDQIFRAADLLVVPLVPAPLAMRTLSYVEEHLQAEHREKQPALLPVYAMVDRRKKLHREMLEAHKDWSAIPQASVVEQMAVKQLPLAEFARHSPAAMVITQIWAKVEAILA